MLISLLTSNPLLFIPVALSLLVSITVHEFAHAYAADQLGDPTPRLQGRLTLNPLKHLDPLGTALLLFLNFGWGKPVQFDPYNLANPRRDAAIISLAGPASNLIVASIASLLIRSVFGDLGVINLMLQTLIQFNVVLAVFNLVPVHPLDGGKIIVGLLPHREAHIVDRIMNQYGLIILMLLIFPILGGVSIISTVITPVVNALLSIYLPGRYLL